MTTLIDRITKRIDELKKSTCTKSIVDELERVKAELTAVNVVDEIIWKRTEQHKLDLPEQDMCSKQNLIQLFIDDLKDIKQTPVASHPNKTIREWRIIDGKQVILEREIDQPTEQRLKDSQPNEVEIKKIKNIYQDCPNCEQDNCLILNDMNYCPGCGSKIKWIA